jgi:hypothetical protein
VLSLVCGSEHLRSGMGCDGVHQNRGRLLRGGVARVVLLRCWRRPGVAARTSGRLHNPGNPTVDFHGEQRSNATHQSTTDLDARLAWQGPGKKAKLSMPGTC